MRSILKMLLNPLAPIVVGLLIIIAILLFTDVLTHPLVQLMLLTMAFFGWVMIIAMNQKIERRTKNVPDHSKQTSSRAAA